MKEQFNIENYPTNTVMHCKTEEDAKIFLEFLDSLGMHWIDREKGSYLTETHWNRYGENTCYNFMRGSFSDIDHYKMHGFSILEFEDYVFDDCFYEISKEENNELQDFLNEFDKAV